MKSKELMIGDWVRRIDNPKPYRIDEIDGISEEVFFADDGTCDGGFYVDLDNLEPIPLTEDILKKNGFVVDKYTSWTQQHTTYTRAENGRRVGVLFKDGKLHSIMVYGFLHYIESYRISSVHEFQNVLLQGEVGFDIEL